MFFSRLNKSTKSPEVKELFTSGDIKRLLVPLIIETTLALSVGLADSLMVSSLGEAAGSAVSLIDGFNVVIISVFNALATGGAVVTAQYIGAKKEEDAKQTASQLIVLCFFIALCACGLSLLLNRQLIRLCYGNIEADVMAYARSYFYITALSFPFIAVYNSAAALFRCVGNSGISMKVSLVANLMNVAGNAVFIYLLNLGVAGAALSTLIARAFAAVFLFIRILDRNNRIYAVFGRGFRLCYAMIKRILYIGIPAGIETIIFQLGRLVVVVFITGFGTSQLAANSVALTLDSLGTNVAVACQMAMLTVAGQCVGYGSIPTYRYYVSKMMHISYLLNFLMNAAVAVTLPLTTALYSYSAETLALATRLVLIYTVSAMLMWPAAFILPHGLRAANDVRFTTLVSVGAMLICRVALGYVLCVTFSLGATGIWCAMTVDWIVRTVLNVIRYKSGKWIKVFGRQVS